MQLKIEQLKVSEYKRLICISDIHGEPDLLRTLLDKVGFCDDDVLVVLGDIFLKGSQPHACLRYVMKLDERPNVHVLRGNCDFAWTDGEYPGGTPYLNDADVAWLEGLPHIIESEDFIFVHAGINSQNLADQDPQYCMRNDAFLENYNGPPFEKWVMVGHWSNVCCCRCIPNHNPIVDTTKRIIAIDGGNVVNTDGQLNAFIVKDSEFSWTYADKFSAMTMKSAQTGNPGTLNIAWPNRFVDIMESGAEFSQVRHLASGKILTVPTGEIWQDNNGNTCISAMATDHWHTVSIDDTVYVVEVFSDRIFAKKDGISGWILKEE